MNNIRISDITLKQKAAELLTFREKIELVKLLDRLQADVIELAPIKNTKADSLFIKSVVNTVNECCVSVQTGPDKEAIEEAWDALKTAKHPRIQICAPVSLVQMEYIYHWAPEKMVEAVIDSVSLAKELCADVEFLAEDATRADKGFLYEIIEAAAEAGATAITICDSAGTLLPGEFAGLTSDILENANTSAASGVILGICADNSLAMADACSIAAACAGAREVKAAIYPDGSASIENIVNIIKQRGNDIRLSCSVRSVEISRIADQAARMFTQEKSKTSPFENGVQSADEGRFYTADDDISAIVKETEAFDLFVPPLDEPAKQIDRISGRQKDFALFNVPVQVIKVRAQRLDRKLIVFLCTDCRTGPVIFAHDDIHRHVKV